MAQGDGTKIAGWLAGVAALLAVLGFFLLRSPSPAPPSAGAPAPVTPPAAAGAPRALSKLAGLPPLRPPAPPPPPPRPDGGTFGPFSLINPAATVSTQVRLLEDGDDEAFRETFVPSMRDKVTPDAIAACRKRLAQVRVQPDWEMAEDSTAGGERVERVSMWGKSMTGFHDVNGRWLADALWCVPTGLP